MPSGGRFDRLSGVRTYPFLEHDGPIPFAHRGGAGWVGRGPVENSLAAFQRAVDLGYRYLETDVHATSDGVLLAFHDKLLDRVTDSAGRVAALRADEVAKARIGGEEQIPLLEDLLGTFPEARFNIDVKHATAIDPLVTAVRRTNAIERVCVGSFSDRRLAAVRAALGPDLATSFGPRGRPRGPRRIRARTAPPARPGRRPLPSGPAVVRRRAGDHATVRPPRPSAWSARARLDDRRPSRDEPTARPGRGRDHD